MKKITLLVAAFVAGISFQAQAQEAEMVLTQNTDEIFLTTGVSCSGGDNFWIRAYDLPSSGINGAATVTALEFGVQNIDGPEELEVHAYVVSSFPSGFDITNLPSPVAFGTIDISQADVGMKLRADFDTPAVVPAGSTVVAIVAQPYQTDIKLFLGATAEETHTSYLASVRCEIEEPTPVGDVGFPNAKHLVNLVVDAELSTNSVLVGQVAVYPNPSTSVFNVQLPANVEVQSSSLVDILGKTTNVTYNNGVVDASSLAKGVYFLTLNTNQGLYTQKVIKQ